MKRFVTFSITKVQKIVNNVPIYKKYKYVIECDNISKAYDVAKDVFSFDGIQYLRISKTNKDKTRIKLHQEDYKIS